MNKDIIRLTKVVDRFSKIGAATPLSEGVINEIVGSSVIYFRTRVPKNVTLTYNGLAMARQKAMVNEALFEWVIENLLKNAMDALQGKGTIDVRLSDDANWVYIDVKDTGRNRQRQLQADFRPRFYDQNTGLGPRTVAQQNESSKATTAAGSTCSTPRSTKARRSASR